MDTKKILEKANKPAEDAMKLHPFYRGKIEIVPKCVVRDLNDFAIWYTPGVAAPCKAIQKNKELVYEYTNKWNSVAVISDGTRVLGLGDIGPEAAMPVMEGKALLFKYLGGVDATPICLDTKDPDKFIETVKLLQPSFGGINLEDIAQPKCFKILATLRKECVIPVWHDDQQGTATVTVAGLINALKIVNKEIDKVSITLVGAGAANICISRLLFLVGANPEKMFVCDSKGILHKGRTELKDTQPEKWDLCLKTNAENRQGGIAEALKNSDVLIALSTPGPGTIKKEWISQMNKEAIVFVCANPVPEIWPWEAKESGARIVATGRSDFPNQVNNSLGFPAIFRGVLDVQARTITDEMCITASRELANYAEKQGLREDYILPTMDEWEVFPYLATAVGIKAIEQNIARKMFTKEELYNQTKKMILRARQETQLLMKEGFIPQPE